MTTIAAGCDAPRTESLESLLPPVLPVAYRTAYHLTRDSADADDIVQEAALNACRAFHTFEQGTNFRAWFLRIVTNVFLMKCRREKRAGGQLPLEDEALDAEGGIALGAGWSMEDPLAATLGRLESAAITEALQDLPEDYRAVAVLYFVEDLAYQDIARIVGCPVGTVRSRLHRARRLLMGKLRTLAIDRGIVKGSLVDRGSASQRISASVPVSLAS
jgi:RNA polymerase sigma-70 factor (ECF subfamily)